MRKALGAFLIVGFTVFLIASAFMEGTEATQYHVNAIVASVAQTLNLDTESRITAHVISMYEACLSSASSGY